MSSNVDPNLSGLQAEQKLSALSVPEGGEVTASVTVTNTATKPLRGVSVNSSLCGDQTTANATLGDDGDSELEKGETWVYLCTQGISQETFAMATVTAQDSRTTATTRQVVRVERANLRMKKKQTNDLRIGKETTYILEVDNNGNIAAPNTVVSDPLDPAVTFVRATTNAGSCSLVEATVKCSLGTIPADTNGAYVINLVVAAKAEGVGKVVENRAQATSSIGDFNPLDNVSSAYGSIFAADQCTTGSRDCQPPPTTEPRSATPDEGPTEALRGSSVTPNQSAVGAAPVNPRLASTGADSITLFTWATLLVASGFGLLGLTRRRRLLTPTGGCLA